MDFPTNIVWTQVVGAACTIAAYFFGKEIAPPAVQQAMVVLLGLATMAVTAYFHWANHPVAVAKLTSNMQAAGIPDTQIKRALLTALMVAFLVPAFLLGGCTSINGIPVPGSAAASTGTIEDQLKNLSQYTIADLGVAEADALAHNDVISAPCYPALQAFVESIPGVTTVGGAFADFQKARDLRNFAAGGLPNSLVLGCGPLYAQVHGDLLLFLSQVAPIHPIIVPGG